MEAQVLQLNGMKYAVLPYEAYAKMIEILEDARDITDAKEIVARIERGEAALKKNEVLLIWGESKGYRLNLYFCCQLVKVPKEYFLRKMWF